MKLHNKSTIETAAAVCIISFTNLFGIWSFSQWERSLFGLHTEGSSAARFYTGEINLSFLGLTPVCLDAVPEGNSLVYSFGGDTTFAFERDLQRIYEGTTVHLFNPTAPELSLPSESSGEPQIFFVHPYAVARRDGWLNISQKDPHEPTLKVDAFTIETLISLFGHRWIDLIMIDIGGLESSMFDDPDGLRGLPVSQVVIETHVHTYSKSDMVAMLTYRFQDAGFDVVQHERFLVCVRQIYPNIID